MALVIKNNMSAQSTLNQLDTNATNMAKDLKKVSTGLRISSAADDASGLAIAERMETQIRALNQDDQNVLNGINMLKVAEGALSNTIEQLTTLKEKVINAANDTNTDVDRQTIQKEFDQTVDQLEDNALVTYNGKYLLDGSKNSEVVPGGTYTHLTNTQLSKDTNEDTYLVDLKDAAGNSLGILPTDRLVVSYVKQGETYTVQLPNETTTGFEYCTLPNLFDDPSFQGDFSTISFTSEIGTDASGKTVYTADGKNAVTFAALRPGVDGQIAGLTFCFMDQDGNVKKAANAVMDAFVETIRAENPSPDNAIVLHSGTKANQAIKVGLSDMRPVALGLKTSEGNTLNISTQLRANAAVNVLENSLSKALDVMTKIGSINNRLEYTSANLVLMAENTQASESTIRDADMAKEMTAYTKNNVLLQASQSMLAQANSNSSAVLSLLQG